MPSMTVTSAAMRVLQSSRGLRLTLTPPTGGIGKNFPAPPQRISAAPQRTAEDDKTVRSTTAAASSAPIFTNYKGTKVRVRTCCAGRLCTGQRLVLVLDAVVLSGAADGYVVCNGRNPLKTMPVRRDEVKMIDAAG